MTVILSFYYLAHSKAAKNMFWFLVGLFLIHFIISGVIIWGLKEEIDAIKDNIKLINSYVLIIFGLALFIYALIPRKSKSKKVKTYPKYYGTLPFAMGIIAPFVDFPALVEYVFLAIQINILFDNSDRAHSILCCFRSTLNYTFIILSDENNRAIFVFLLSSLCFADIVSAILYTFFYSIF